MVQEIAKFLIQEPNFIQNQKETWEATSAIRTGKTVSTVEYSTAYKLQLKATPTLVWWINDLHT